MFDKDFQFEISLSVLNHLGRNLYRNFLTVLGEAISNAWDADAKNVWIDIDKENSTFSIKDDGTGMTASDFQSKFLKIGYSKRKDGATKTRRERPFIGAKGIGKLALLSCAKRVSIFTKTKSSEYVGGVIDNSGLDAAIHDDLIPSEYPLENLNFGLISDLSDDHHHGTIIVFEQTKEVIRNSEAHIKKLLAMSFKFSLIDEQFNIHVNGKSVNIDDLKDLSRKTEFLWVINNYEDEYTKKLNKLQADPLKITTALNLKGFIATVEKPRYLKITGTDERATIDLFVNGRLREKNIIRHIPTQRILESYIYDQIHFDFMDSTDSDPFTSSREGIIEDDKNFQELLNFLKKDVLPQILEDWDELRLARGQDGDDENKRKSKKERRALSLYAAATDDYRPESGSPGKKRVNDWLKDLRQDAEFNLASYVDCFLAENLVRKYIGDQGIPTSQDMAKEIKKWRTSEENGKDKAGISFDIGKNDNDLNFLGMDYLAIAVEGFKKADAKPSLWKDATNYKPVRNAVCHTSLLSRTAKNHLNVTFDNIKSRVVKLISE